VRTGRDLTRFGQEANKWKQGRRRGERQKKRGARGKAERLAQLRLESIWWEKSLIGAHRFCSRGPPDPRNLGGLGGKKEARQKGWVELRQIRTPDSPD